MSLWIAGARPRTLPAAVVPVLVGTACAVGSEEVMWWRCGLALIVSLALQVGVNYANDYSDGIRGTDESRVGPLRLVGSGVASATAVKRAAIVSLLIAALAGLVLALLTSLWLLVVGVLALVAAWTYTGGPRPYGYAGFGEFFVFIFFGVVATTGSTFAVAETITAVSWVASIGVGCFACALLVVNNLRDIPGDTASGKLTLAVRLGDGRTRVLLGILVLCTALVVAQIAVVTTPWAALAFLGVIAGLRALRPVRTGAKGRELIVVLGEIGRAQLLYGVTLAVGLAVGL